MSQLLMSGTVFATGKVLVERYMTACRERYEMQDLSDAQESP